MAETPHYDIVFATPGNSMKFEYVKSLVETMYWLSDRRISYHLVSQQSSFVPSAREKTATDSEGQDWEATGFGAGKFTYGRILWIDSDISWTVEAFKMLWDSPEDIISGMYAVDRTGRIAAMNLESGHPVSISSLNLLLEAEPLKVDGVGFGFLMVKYGVFEKMLRPWFQIRSASLAGVDFPVMFGEDYSWCLGAKEAGFDIWLHPLCKVEHHKELVLTV
jgi:hypothetical protein